MIQLPTLVDLKRQREEWQHDVVAAVLTMGSLHEGHYALVKRAKALADKVIVSIYVNPLQFGPTEDFERYPRPLDADLTLCEAWGVDAVFTPADDQLYPQGREKQCAIVPPEALTEQLCGLHRPGHFTGVATVVLKLLQLIQPQVTVFGLKDAQQFAVVQALIDSFNLPVYLEGVDCKRADDGMALSSRNLYLSPVEREQALGLSQLLLTLQQQILQNPSLPVSTVLPQIQQQALPLLQKRGFELEYLSAVVLPELTPLTQPLQSLSAQQQQQVFLLTAAKLGKARLIDSLRLTTVLSAPLLPEFSAIAAPQHPVTV